MARRILAVAGLVSLLSAAPLRAREAWIVQFDIPFPDFPPCRSVVAWHSRFTAHNGTDLPLTVGLLGVSNGRPRGDAQPLQIPPHRTVSLLGQAPGGPNWEPDVASPRLWVDQIDVPDGVSVSDRAESEINALTAPTPTGCAFNHYYSAGLTFRIYDQLVPAGVPQHHLGLDIGGFLTGGGPSVDVPSFDSRINVGVFNASTTQASVQIQVFCSAASADPLPRELDALVASERVTVPPNSIVQQDVLPSTLSAPRPLLCSLPYHVVVTSDQPGFSYAVTLSNESLPQFSGFAPVTF